MTGADVAHLLAYTRVRARSHMLALSSIHGRAPEFLSLQSAAPRCLTARGPGRPGPKDIVLDDAA